MTTAFAADAAGRVRGGVVHLRVGDSTGGAGVVWPGGVVVTNAHVATERRVILRLPDGSVVEGETIWRDPARDLAAVAAPGLAGSWCRSSPAMPAGSAPAPSSSPSAIPGEYATR